MKASCTVLLAALVGADALNIQMSAAPAGAKTTSVSKTGDPLLMRAARGEVTETTPVWMMRQVSVVSSVAVSMKTRVSGFE